MNYDDLNDYSKKNNLMIQRKKFDYFILEKLVISIIYYLIFNSIPIILRTAFLIKSIICFLYIQVSIVPITSPAQISPLTIGFKVIPRIGIVNGFPRAIPCNVKVLLQKSYDKHKGID